MSVSGSRTMLAMRLRVARGPLVRDALAVPEPGPNELLLKVLACGVCRTDLHIVDGELSGGKRPITPGHEVVGTVVGTGSAVERYRETDRVGVPWLAASCGRCVHCLAGRENLCDQARFTGYDQDGGYAQYMLADARYCLPLPQRYGDAEAAPLLCAGLIGYRSYAMAGDARRIGLYGFGAAAHILAQVAQAQGHEVYAFTRPGDASGQAFARRLGAVWAGGSDEAPPEPLDAAILFAPAGGLVPTALRHVRKGGCVVCGGIHMSDIPSFPYALLWGERRLQSVANLTRADGAAFMKLAASIPIRAEVHTFALDAANEALAALRDGSLDGAAVLVP